MRQRLPRKPARSTRHSDDRHSYLNRFKPKSCFSQYCAFFSILLSSLLFFLYFTISRIPPENDSTSFIDEEIIDQCEWPYSTLEVPGPTANSKFFVMESALQPKSRVLTTVTLTKHYFYKINNQAFILNSAPQAVHKIKTELVLPKDYSLWCFFSDGSWSEVVNIPESATRDENSEQSAHVMTCDIPESVSLKCDRLYYRIATNEASLEHSCDGVEICLDLWVDTRTRARSKITTNIIRKHDAPRMKFMMCTEPIYTRVPFLTEYLAHYFHNLDVPHIILGYNFEVDPDDDWLWLQDVTQSWVREGRLTLWKWQFTWIRESDHMKQQWTHGALHVVKDMAEYILMNDPDEFIVIAPEFANLEEVIYSVENHEQYCWQQIPSFRVWKEYNPDADHLVERYWGRENKQLWHWTKLFWNTDNLHYGGFHHGGACSAQNRDWSKVVNEFREDHDHDFVYRWDAEKVRLLHFYNVYKNRVGYGEGLEKPWFPLTNDTALLERYLPTIKAQLRARGLKPPFAERFYHAS